MLFAKNNIQNGLQLNLWNEFEIGVINFALSPQQLCHLLKHCTCYIMSTSANVPATTRKLFEQKNDNIDIMSNGKKDKLVLWLCLAKNRQRAKKLFPNVPLWLGYHALNVIICENGESFETTLSVSELVKIGMTHDQILKHLEVVPSFPYIPQEAWPFKKIDGKMVGILILPKSPLM